jgi:hypothetical protein
MQSIWSESWKSSEFITTKIAFTSRSVAALQENDLANRYPPMPSLITTLGGTIAAVCFRCQSQRNYEFAMDRRVEPRGDDCDEIANEARGLGTGVMERVRYAPGRELL